MFGKGQESKTNYGLAMPGSKHTVKKQGLASKKVRQFAQFIDSDSDSYGSQGGLKVKEKPVEKIKTRGGKKRNQVQFPNKGKEDSDDDDEDVGTSQAEQTEQSKEFKNAKREYIIKVAKNLKADEDSDNGLENLNKDINNCEMEEESDQTVEAEEKGVVPENEPEEAKVEYPDDTASVMTEQTVDQSYYNDPAFQAASKNIDRYADIFKKAGSINTDRRGDSPPMIKEYNPHEENARERAQKRKEEVKKRQAQVKNEVDMTQFPDDPTPWKSRSSDFFIVHEQRRTGEMVMNNSQKEFLLIYYPDNIVDEISMMGFLHKQAKAHEERHREREEHKQIKTLELRGNLKKQKKNKQRNKDRQIMPEYVQEISHINQENRYMSQQPFRGGVNFDNLLNETKHTQVAGLRLNNIRDQIQKIHMQADTYYDSSQTMQAQHADMASTGGGYCSHCHNHMGIAGPTGYSSQLMGATHTEYDTAALERQRIMQQICEAKKRQARMEAEEARRLRDEAKRLADQARILDMEAQRPLLEAKRLEQECLMMERQFGRIPGHSHMGGSSVADARLENKMGFGSQPPATPISMDDGRPNPYIEETRRIIESKRDALIADAQTTQFQIASLQANAQRLEQSSMVQRNQSYDINPLYSKLEENRRMMEQQRQSSMRQQVAAQNAQMYAAQALKEKADRAERVDLENAQKEAMRAKTELAKLQAKQAKRELKETKKGIKQKESDEIRADRGRGRDRDDIPDKEKERKKIDIDGGDAYGEEVQYEWKPKKEAKGDWIDAKTGEVQHSDDSKEDVSEKRKSVKEEDSSDEYSSDEEPMNLKKTVPKKVEEKIPPKVPEPVKTKKVEISPKAEVKPKAATIKKEKPVPKPSYDMPTQIADHYDQEVDYGEEDPEIALANQEFLKAKKMFEKAQKAAQDVKNKKEREIQKQKNEIFEAQEQANKYFAELKRQKEEEKKSKPKKQTPNNQQSQYETGAEYLYGSFDKSIETMGERSKELFDRYSNRYGIQELLSPILSGRIINEFDPSKGYINFAAHYLEDNFQGGHDEYFKKWKHLFLYEAYSYMMNSRWSKFTGSDIDMKNQLQAQKNEKALCWKGYFVYKQMEGRFCCLKMLKEPMNVLNFNSKKNYSKIYDEPDRFEGSKFDLNHCREEDLIVISKQRINLQGNEDIKMAPGGVNFLRDVLNKQGVTFGFVYRVNTKTNNFVEVLVDPKFAKTYQAANDTNNDGAVFTRYCYFFESLLTASREFRALKQLEFTRLCPILCYPTLALEAKDKMLDDYCNQIQKSFGSYDDSPDLEPKIYYKDEEQSYHQMNHYLLTNHNKYNKSQAQVLENVIEMPKDEVLLIQGPPGTGKTHTIIGIISMILSTRLNNPKQKIMVCAPSNAAIDQIILRIVEKGLIGLQGLKKLKKKIEVNPKNQQKAKKAKQKKNLDTDTEESDSDEYYDPPDLQQSLVRITSAEYNTENAIKKYTLEQRILKKLCIEKFGDLKKCIKELKDLINQMDDFDCWEEYQDFPYCNKVKYKTYSKVLNAGYLKKVHNWGDHSLTREQQKVTFTQQLKIHEKELNEFKSGTNMEQGNMEWKDAEQAIINESNIICCTLSMAGSAKLFPFVNSFEYLIVDEACQSTEPSTLIPFQHAPKRVILVGDQKQLPATTFSGNSEETGYCRSLFERLLDSGYDKTMLTIQFRMHPKIRAFPSDQFYGGAITDHQSIGVRNAPLTIANLARIFPSRIIFFDIQCSDEVLDNKSKCNIDEADFTKILIDFMARKMSLQGTLKYIAGQIGVISPYKAQVRLLHQKLEQLCSDQSCNIQETIEVNTVDAFQGSEKDIIIFNSVRSNAEDQIQKSLGFLLDERRLNVAITRPKYFLLIVGNAKTLQKSDTWDNMIRYCQNQGRYVEIRNRAEFEYMTDLKKYVLPQLQEYE